MGPVGLVGQLSRPTRPTYLPSLDSNPLDLVSSCKTKDQFYEENFPTEQSETAKNPRVSGSNEDPKRTKCA